MKIKNIENLLAKLRQPVHISFIADRILQKELWESKEIIMELIEEDMVEESPLGKEYYVVKKQS
jgi:hypothetical protein